MNYFQQYNLQITKNSIWLFKTPNYETTQNLNYIQEFGFFHAHPGYYTKRANLKGRL